MYFDDEWVSVLCQQAREHCHARLYAVYECAIMIDLCTIFSDPLVIVQLHIAHCS